MDWSHFKTNKVILLLLVISNIGVYGLAYMRTSFYNIIIEALNLTNFDLSQLLSVFGLISFLSYLFGGVFSDYFSSKKIIILALIFSGVLHLYTITMPSQWELVIIFGLMAIAAVFMFYPASTKILSGLNGGRNQGRNFSFYYALIPLLSIFMTVIAINLLKIVHNATVIFQIMVAVYALINFLSAIGIYLLLDETPDSKFHKSTANFSSVIGNRNVWFAGLGLMSIIILVNSLTYINPLLNDLYNLDEQTILYFSILRLNILPVITGPIFGIIADRIGSTIKVLYSIVIAAFILLIPLMGLSFWYMPLIVIMIIILLFSALSSGGKGIGITVAMEILLPKNSLGSAIGLISLIGFSPDFYFFPIAGKLLDVYGNRGYGLIYGFCILTSIIGLVSMFMLQKAAVHPSNCDN